MPFPPGYQHPTFDFIKHMLDLARELDSFTMDRAELSVEQRIQIGLAFFNSIGCGVDVIVLSADNFRKIPARMNVDLIMSNELLREGYYGYLDGTHMLCHKDWVSSITFVHFTDTSEPVNLSIM